jgi:hypothetical protein
MIIALYFLINAPLLAYLVLTERWLTVSLAFILNVILVIYYF